MNAPPELEGHEEMLIRPRLAAAAVVAVAALTPCSLSSAGWFSDCFGGSQATSQSAGTADDGGICCCLRPVAPPRGQVAISIPARVNVQSGAQAGAQAASDRLDKLEEDLTRLTVIVEKMTEKNQQIDVDLARLTVLVEELVRRQPPAASGAQ
jgi:hypothetical protein